jgi:hypothetical protein
MLLKIDRYKQETTMLNVFDTEEYEFFFGETDDGTYFDFIFDREDDDDDDEDEGTLFDEY